MEIFETERLVVRRYRADEFENYFLINGDEEVVRYIRPVQDRAEAMASFAGVLKDYEERPGFGRWAAHLKSAGEFVGSFAIIPIASQPEKIQMGYAFPKQSWGKGYATELTDGGLLHYWQNFEGDTVYGLTEVPNLASQKVLLKAGFRFESTMMEKDIELYVYVCHRRSGRVVPGTELPLTATGGFILSIFHPLWQTVAHSFLFRPQPGHRRSMSAAK